MSAQTQTDQTHTAGPRYSASEIAEALGEAPPTPEQRAIIEAKLEPTLVIAGAGSGKTQTIADRVVYLVANGIIRPDEVLGVTYTRKAAGELSERVSGQLAQLLHKLPETRSVILPEQIEGPDGVVDPSDLLTPTISTYHSYAQSLVTEHGLRIGVEPEVEVIGEARGWQIVQPLVDQYEHGARFIETKATPSTLAKQVLKLSTDCSEHLTTPEQIEDYLDSEIARAEQYVEEDPKAGALNATQLKVVNALNSRREIVELLRRYRMKKDELGVMDFGDLLTYAVRIAAEIPAAAEAERSKYALVLLDEFQDTSFAQLELFSGLFGRGAGHAVTAVGDPNQSIYGFRGASAGQLFDFPARFPVVDPQTGNRSAAPRKYLSVAWRNSHAALEAANVLVEPFVRWANHPQEAWHHHHASLRAELPPLVTPDCAAKDTAVPVDQGGEPVMDPEKVAPGVLRYGFYPTEADEAAAIVEQLTEALRHTRDTVPGHAEVIRDKDQGLPVTAAVLARKRAQLHTIAETLEAAGIAHEVVGGAGLTRVPEVAEVLSYLRVIADPQRSDELLRILAGARYRLGPKDLYRLGRMAEKVPAADRSLSGQSEDDEQVSLALEPDELRSLPQALDSLTGGDLKEFSPAGAERLLRAKTDFLRLRGLTSSDLAGLVRAVIAETGIDVELAAAGRSALQIDELIGHAQAFGGGGSHTDLRAFLSWLEIAEEEEQGLKTAVPEPTPGAVQLLTVHSSKGLQWDVVVVAGLREGRLPDSENKVPNWLKGTGDLPWPLRGDRCSMPQWDSDQPTAQFWARAAGEGTTKKFEDRDLPDQCKSYQREEDRRLAYVAVTRVKSLLITTGACFYGSTQGKEASPFLEEIRTAAGVSPHPQRFEELSWYEFDPQDKPENPSKNLVQAAVWPYDPLAPLQIRTLELIPANLEDPSSLDEYREVAASPAVPGRRPALEAARDLVRAQSPPLHPGPAEAHPKLAEAQFVIQRRTAVHRPPQKPGIPSHTSASGMVQLLRHPQQMQEESGRPVPRRPASAARRGTAVHGIIEDVLDVQASLPDIDGIFDTLDDDAADLNIEQVRASFQSSRWARWPAFAVEIPVETPVGGIVVRGRIDAVFAVGPDGRHIGTETYQRWLELPRAERIAKMSQCRFELVDWKTGRIPQGQDMAEKELQLAVYRIAFSRLHGVEEQNIACHFLYLDHAHTHTPAALPGAEDLETLVRSVGGTD